MGLFFCASLEDQFEHILGAWVNQRPLAHTGREGGSGRDPLIGNHLATDAPFVIPVDEAASLSIHFQSPLVTTKGMAYAFFPSKEALRQLANGSVIEKKA